MINDDEWVEPLDPCDLKEYVGDWSDQLESVDDRIISITITPPALATTEGLIINRSSFEPFGKVTVWFEVDAAQQDNARWTGLGQRYDIDIKIETQGGRRIEKSATLRVAQQ